MAIVGEGTQPRRAPALQAFLDAFVEKTGIDAEFMTASDHRAECMCPACFNWWVTMGDEENGYGPFDPDKVRAAQVQRDIVPFDPTPFMDTDMLGVSDAA